MGSYRLVMDGMHAAHLYDASNLRGLAMHKIQPCLLNSIFHASVGSKSISGHSNNALIVTVLTDKLLKITASNPSKVGAAVSDALIPDVLSQTLSVIRLSCRLPGKPIFFSDDEGKIRPCVKCWELVSTSSYGWRWTFCPASCSVWWCRELHERTDCTL